jgi:hypothetical protein
MPNCEILYTFLNGSFHFWIILVICVQVRYEFVSTLAEVLINSITAQILKCFQNCEIVKAVAQKK